MVFKSHRNFIFPVDHPGPWTTSQDIQSYVEVHSDTSRKRVIHLPDDARARAERTPAKQRDVQHHVGSLPP
jgi:hypothetical protein